MRSPTVTTVVRPVCSHLVKRPVRHPSGGGLCAGTMPSVRPDGLPPAPQLRSAARRFDPSAGGRRSGGQPTGARFVGDVMDFGTQGPEAPAGLAWLRGVDAYTMGAYPQAEEEF